MGDRLYHLPTNLLVIVIHTATYIACICTYNCAPLRSSLGDFLFSTPLPDSPFRSAPRLCQCQIRVDSTWAPRFQNVLDRCMIFMLVTRCFGPSKFLTFAKKPRAWHTAMKTWSLTNIPKPDQIHRPNVAMMFRPQSRQQEKHHIWHRTFLPRPNTPPVSDGSCVITRQNTNRPAQIPSCQSL